MSSVLLTIPNQHWIHKHVAYRADLMLQDKRHKVHKTVPSHKPYVDNLHRIVKDFRDGGYDFWLNMDADNPPVNNPLDLVELDKDIIGLPTPIWHFTKEGERPYYFNAYDFDGDTCAYREHQPQKGLQKVDAVGTGCILISRRVFENSFMCKAPFMRGWTEEGFAAKGNDIRFCEKARNQGFEIYAHYDYPCDHFTELSMLEMIRAFKGVRDG